MPLTMTRPEDASATGKHTRQVALVTGGTRGIGRAIAEELMANHCDVIVTYHSNDLTAHAMQDEFLETLTVIKTDVSCEQDVAQLFADVIERFGKIDILVNNAGITQDKTFHKMDAADWHRVMDVNLHGAFYCCSQVIPLMREQGFGRIINISSVVGQQGNFGQANYAASKAGMLGLTKTLALENAQKGITVNAVCPGFIATEMVEAIPDSVKEKIQAQIPMKRFGTSLEIAKAVQFLASPHAAYITGQAINVNGGLLTA